MVAAAVQLKSFSSREAMMQHTVRDAEGTLAFVSSTGTLFLKVSQGWKEIQPRPAYQIRGDTMQRIHAVSERLNLVALNQPHSGDMMGADAADRMCFEQAKAMGLPPNYRAFLSSRRQDLLHVVHSLIRHSLPITNLRGDVMFRNWNAVFSGDGAKSVWHGTATRGLRGLDKHCESWRTEHMSVTGLSSNLLSGRLLGQLTRSCTNQYIVLCIESHKST
ncbi:hypothetical protein CRUP_035390 [Coryphaenoides rupestris]|nr:hypothetical protein CRUP_035390 [Coryphaenoides rupestris]